MHQRIRLACSPLAVGNPDTTSSIHWSIQLTKHSCCSYLTHFAPVVRRPWFSVKACFHGPKTGHVVLIFISSLFVTNQGQKPCSSGGQGISVSRNVCREACSLQIQICNVWGVVLFLSAAISAQNFRLGFDFSFTAFFFPSIPPPGGFKPMTEWNQLACIIGSYRLRTVAADKGF